MRIVVLVKQTLDPRGILVRRDKEKIFVNREDYILEAGSKAAIEAGMHLKETSGAEVVAISLGKPQADDALREALAMGCDRAVLLCDSTFADADASAAARILGAAIQKLGGADLVLAGRESGDTGLGQIGPRLAEALGYAQCTDAQALAIDGGGITAIRGWGTAYARVSASLPAVVTVAHEAFPARYPHGARIMNAYREWQVPVWGMGDLGLSEADLAPMLSFRGESFPAPLEVGETFRGDPDRLAQDIVMGLKRQGVIH